MDSPFDACVLDGHDGLTLSIFAKPKARRSQIVGVREGALEVAIAAPPVDGEANSELIRFLSRALSVPRSQLILVRGDSHRRKQIRVHGIGREALLRALVDAFPLRAET